MLNLTATVATASARFAVCEYMEELVPCAFEEDAEFWAFYYGDGITSRWDVEEGFFFNGGEREGVTVEISNGVIVPARYGDYILSERHYDEVVRPRLEAWLRTPEAREDINYSDIYKDVYGYRPRR